VAHVWGDDVWARGAAALVLQQVYMDPATPLREISPGPAVAQSIAL
jgi:hypothetical protein